VDLYRESNKEEVEEEAEGAGVLYLQENESP
jgi:hypothetical protein